MTTRTGRSHRRTALIASMAILLLSSLLVAPTGVAAQDDDQIGQGANEPTSRRVAFVAGTATTPTADRAIARQLRQLGFEVDVFDDDDLDIASLVDADLVMVSSSVVPSKINDDLRDIAVPLVTWEAYLFDDFGLATKSGQTLRPATSVRIDPSIGDHPLAAGHGGSARIVVPPAPTNYGAPGPDAVVIAREAAKTGRPVSFAYGKGARLVDQTRAPARRVALFPTYSAAARLTNDGWQLFLAAVEWALDEPNVATWVTVLHTNDGESQLRSVRNVLPDFGGVARFATLIDELRHQATVGRRTPAQADGIRVEVTVAAGDNIAPSPELVASLESGPPYHDSVALDRLGFDAIGIGSHDLDYGPNVFAELIAGHRRPVPYLSANLDFDDVPRLAELADAGRLAASTVVNDRGVRIGIVAVTTPHIPSIANPGGIEVSDDLVGAATTEIERLRNRQPDLIILLSHLGGVQADADLVAELEDVDIVVSGGGDELLSNPEDLLIPEPNVRASAPYPLLATGADDAVVPIVTTRGRYGYVGRLMVGFDADGNLVQIDGASGPVRVSGNDRPDAVPPDPELERDVLAPLRLALDAKANNRIAVSEVGLDTTRTRLRFDETNAGNLVADSLLWQARRSSGDLGVAEPDFAIQNSGGIRASDVIAPGDIAELDTFALLPFANFVTIVTDVPRPQVKELLENAVSRAVDEDPAGGTGRFAQVAGIGIVWDPGGRAQVTGPNGEIVVSGTRIRSAELDSGEVLVQDGRVRSGPALTVATTDSLAAGGDGYPFRDAVFTVATGVSSQSALADYLQLGLGGFVTLAEYPEGGQGRITTER